MAIQQSQVLPLETTVQSVDDQNSRSYGHYLLAIASLSFYGGQVCPYVEALGLLDNALLIALLFGSMALARPVLYKKIVTACQPQGRMAAVIKLDIGLYFTAALILSAYFLSNYEVPLSTVIKLVFGFGFLGGFAALDAALMEERRSVGLSIDSPSSASDHTIPLARSINLFTLVVCLGLVTVMLLLVFKDMEWLLSESRELDDMQAAALIGFEFFVVLVVVLGSYMHVVSQYGENLSLRLASQAGVLAEVAEGQLNKRIHDPGNDEIRRLSDHINKTLVDLEIGHHELTATRDLTIRAMSSLAETRDNETGLHIVRTQHYVKLLAQNLMTHPDFSRVLQPSFVELLYKSAPLHDVGKIGIPDHILLKPGKLTDEEFAVMRTHAALGRDALAAATTGNEASAFLCLAQEIALNHHEKWDGTGYPSQLSGEAIPLSARLMALADVYDALISKRVYKTAMTHLQARSIILEGRGTHFDPRVVDSFLATEKDFIRIADEYGD